MSRCQGPPPFLLALYPRSWSWILLRRYKIMVRRRGTDKEADRRPCILTWRLRQLYCQLELIRHTMAIDTGAIELMKRDNVSTKVVLFNHASSIATWIFRKFRKNFFDFMTTKQNIHTYLLVFNHFSITQLCSIYRLDSDFFVFEYHLNVGGVFNTRLKNELRSWWYSFYGNDFLVFFQLLSTPFYCLVVPVRVSAWLWVSSLALSTEAPTPLFDLATGLLDVFHAYSVCCEVYLFDFVKELLALKTPSVFAPCPITGLHYVDVTVMAPPAKQVLKRYLVPGPDT